MTGRDNREFYRQLRRDLTDRRFLKRMGLTKKEMLRALDEMHLEALALRLGDELGKSAEAAPPLSSGAAGIPKSAEAQMPVDCSSILDICRPALRVIMKSLRMEGDQEPEEGWLESIRRRILLSLYPEAGVKPPQEEFRLPELFFCEILHAVLTERVRRCGHNPAFDFLLLSEEEAAQYPAGEEYVRFLKLVRRNYIYEFLVISAAVQPFRALGHIAGVHHVAMHMAVQLRQLGLPVDLAMVSAASAAHDIGKFGCREAEARRIPHLHYYYTDDLLLRAGLPGIAHIASNHSTWDLELEDLSCENLILIYADFRVKSTRDARGRELACFYSLRQAFDVILNKLENVDLAKRDRYVRVYEKLRDFESYMISLGAEPDLTKRTGDPGKWKHVTFLNAAESVQRLKYLAIAHNIDVMHRFGAISEFGDLLEEARSERQWENIRAYISTLDEYSTYLTSEQKQMAIRFLQELLMQRGGDIRRQAAVLIGKIIACYDERYRKELPEGVRLPGDQIDSRGLWREHLQSVLNPDSQRTEQQRRWMGYSLKLTMKELLMQAGPDDRRAYLALFLEQLETGGRDDTMVFVLLDSILEIPAALLNRDDYERILDFCRRSAQRQAAEIRIAVLRAARYAAQGCVGREHAADREHAAQGCEGREQGAEPEQGAGHDLREQILALAETCGSGDHRVSVIFLRDQIRRALLPDGEDRTAGAGDIAKVPNSAIFRENLKVGTPWVIRVVNIEVMLHDLKEEMSPGGADTDAGTRKDQHDRAFYVATHLSNLLKVSERTTIRHTAGKALIEVFGYLTREQKHEIVVELIKGLEIGDYQFSKYIPPYLGTLITRLHPDEIYDVIRTLQQLLQNRNDKVACVTLDTLGIILRNGVREEEGTGSVPGDTRQHRERIIGMLLFGMAHYHAVVSREAFQVIGQTVFGSAQLPLPEKAEIFRVLCKKMLTLIEDNRDDHLRFFTNAASLNHIYRFISDHQFFCGTLPLSEEKKAAFFPGTFDPFSLGHKGIVTTIRDAGYEVYLALDEFSWSKNTEARMYRKHIMTMSCADMIGVYVFPDDQPINIAAPPDIRRLRSLLPGKEVYIVVGSDVIANASSYRKLPEPDSIHSMNHIVFQRESAEGSRDGRQDYREGMSRISGRIIELTLPTQLEDISSTRIRENIDQSRDISGLIDPVVQNYIYDNALYMRQPTYKQIMQVRQLRLRIDRSGGVIHGVELMDGSRENAKIAELTMSPVESARLYEEFHDRRLAAIIRERASGRVLVIRSVRIASGLTAEDPGQLILTEALAEALKDDYTYAVFQDRTGSGDPSPKGFIDTLLRQGFREIIIDGEATKCFGVDMKNPVTLLQNMRTVIKSPLNRNPRVESVLHTCHTRLQESLTELFPDTLILSCDSDVMHRKLIQMITEENGASAVEGPRRVLGPHMCVPFGKILNNIAVPNTVTKTLHLEKSFSPDLSGFSIREYPNYACIEDQVRTIRSFRRQVILVDDILHRGYRIQHLDPVLNANGIRVRKLIVGILSGTGKDLMTVQDRDVDSVYFLPNMKAWFVESSQYPFIGGDGVERHTGTIDDDFTAINMILPYVLPSFLSRQCTKPAIYEFSMTCLENARDILKVLEEEYQKEFQRKLTLQRLPEVIQSPKLTDVGQCLDFDRALAASAYVEDDIERLQRMKGLL